MLKLLPGKQQSRAKFVAQTGQMISEVQRTGTNCPNSGALHL